MYTVRTKFGKIYVQEFTDSKKEEGRLKIYDSDMNYLSYLDEYFLEEEARFKEVSKERYLYSYVYAYEHEESLDNLLDMLGVYYEFTTKDVNELNNFLKENGYEDRYMFFSNEFVNKIGDTYIVIAE